MYCMDRRPARSQVEFEAIATVVGKEPELIL